MQNPFTYTFGVKPREYIRNDQADIILNNFSYAEPTERSYMITGIRGSGKTVLLAEISEQISQQDDWIVIDLNPARDLLTSLGARLYELPFMKRFFLNAKIDLSVLGFGVSIEKGTGIFDIESALEKMLEAIHKNNKKLLITIDEASPAKEMRVFCLSFQSMIRKKLPVYLVLTGLYNNIHNLKNMEGCTFLQRSPFIVIKPLEISAIAVRYKNTLKLKKSTAIELAKLTKGYAFAFQVLGKLYFDKNDSDTLEDILDEYESELIIYSYNKIWSELSSRDIELIKAMVELSNGVMAERSELIKTTGFSSSMMNRYQTRLREKGILDTTSAGHGKYSFALPLFADFVKDYHMDEQQ